MDIQEIRVFRTRLDKDNRETNRMFVDISYKLYDLCLKRMRKLKDLNSKVTASLDAIHGGTHETIFDKIGDKVDVETYINDFRMCLKNIYPGYNEVFEKKYRDGKQDIQIYIENRMHKTSYYRFRADAEEALAGQLLNFGYTFEKLFTIYEEMKKNCLK